MFTDHLAMIGARIFLPPSRLGMIVNHTDETLPKWMRTRLESYGPEMWYFKDRKDGKGTCRSLQTYQSGSRYVTYSVTPLTNQQPPNHSISIV